MELKFKVDTKLRKQWFTDISFSHPAKMSLPLQLWIISKYTKEGEVILDPMAGSGTLLVACSMGRNVICVDLEDKFIKITEGNWEKIQQRGPQLGYEMGWAKIIQGDARDLKGLLADDIIMSPPFGEALSGGGIARYGHFSDPALAQRAYSAENMNIQKQIKRVEEGKAKMKRPDVFTSEGNKAAKGYFEGNYSRDPSNIGNLPYGDIDKIITSPPYAERHSYPDVERERHAVEKLKAHPNSKIGGVRIHEHYSDNPSNLGNLPYGNIDAVITSPPYEDSLSEPEDRKHSIDQSKWRDGRKIAPPHSQVHLTYPSSSDANIGNLKSDSYLQAMLQVYKQCHQVLRPEGLMILVTKDFIRNRKRVDLAGDTIKLCEQAGFTLMERHYRRLPAQSFWRVIYYQKNPNVEKIDTEDILIFKKNH